MYCDKCGAEIQSGTAFCANCGAAVGSAPTEQLAPVYPETPALTPGVVLAWGIVAASVACIPFVNFVGIILGVIALRKADGYLALYGPGSKQVKIGHILSKVGIFGGIGMTLFWIAYIIFIVLMIVNS